MCLRYENLRISKFLIMKEYTDVFQNNQTAYEDKPVSKQIEVFLFPNQKEIMLRYKGKKVYRQLLMSVCVCFYQLICLWHFFYCACSSCRCLSFAQNFSPVGYVAAWKFVLSVLYWSCNTSTAEGSSSG